jgi:KDO2-lipid IV(A) lauroyltransferase
MIVKESLGRDLLRLIVWYPFRWLILILPPARSFTLFAWMGRLYNLFARSKKDQVRRSLEAVMAGRPEQSWDAARIVRGYFETHFASQMQIFTFPRLTRRNAGSVLEVEGMEKINHVLQNEGKGCILVHGHFGPIQLPLCVLGLKGCPMNQVIHRRGENLSFIGEKVQLRLRTHYENLMPARLIPAEGYLRPLVRVLKNNQVVMITGDGTGHKDVIGQTVTVSLFGRGIRFPVGPMKLAAMTGAPVFPVFTFRQDKPRYKTIIGDRIETDRPTEAERIRQGTRRFAALLETWISRYPDHWHFWDNFRKGVLIVDGEGH